MLTLAELLNGSRRIRTPITVGYVWLAVIWLGFGQHIRDVGVHTPTDDSVGALAREAWNAAGAVGQVSAVTFLALIVGSIQVDLLGATPWMRSLRWWVAIDRSSNPGAVEEAHFEARSELAAVDAEISLRTNAMAPLIALAIVLACREVPEAAWVVAAVVALLGVHVSVLRGKTKNIETLVRNTAQQVIDQRREL